MSLPSGYFENTTASWISLNAAAHSVLKHYSAVFLCVCVCVNVWINGDGI